MITEIIETNLATRQDAKDLSSEMERIRASLESKIIQSEYRLTIKLGTIVSLAIGIAVALAKLV